MFYLEKVGWEQGHVHLWVTLSVRSTCHQEWLSYARGQEWICFILLYSTTKYLPLCKKSGQKGIFFNLVHLTWIATSLNVIKLESIPAFHFGDQLSCLSNVINPLNAELNPICHLLALLGAHHILHVSRIRVNLLSLSRANTRLVSQLCHDHFFPHPFIFTIHRLSLHSALYCLNCL